MAIVRDLSGNNPYLDPHIAGASIEIDTTGLATELKQDDLIAAIENLTIDTTGLATEVTLAALLAEAEAPTPVLVTQVAYKEARPITPGTNVAPGNAVMLVCTAAGNQSLELDGGDIISVAVVQGTSFIDNLAVIDAPAAGTTATCVVTVLGPT